MHVQLSFNSTETGFWGWYFLSECLYFLVSVLMEEMTLFKSTKKIVKIRLVKKLCIIWQIWLPIYQKAQGKYYCSSGFTSWLFFCQAPNTKSVPSCLMLKLGSFKNTETVIIAISGLKNNGDEERLSTMCPVTEVRARENFNYWVMYNSDHPAGVNH